MELKLKFGEIELELKGEQSEVNELYSQINFSQLIQTSNVVQPSKKIGNTTDENSCGAKIEENVNENIRRNLGKSKISSKGKNKFVKIQLNISNEDEFIKTFNQHKDNSLKNRIHLLLYLYVKDTGNEEFTLDTIHSLLDLVSIDTPDNLRTILSNYVNRDMTIERLEEGKYKLKHKGKNYIKELMGITE